ncbi:MAG: aa3-type cytochrome oxidase subunit CtaJ [Sciscionella sp.]
MSIWATVLIYVVIPLGVILAVYALGLSSKGYRIPRYRPGQKWNYQPVWWTANPAGLGEAGHGEHSHTRIESGADGDGRLGRTARGGARGSW